jgi:hypothetical protein
MRLLPGLINSLAPHVSIVQAGKTGRNARLLTGDALLPLLVALAAGDVA